MFKNRRTIVISILILAGVIIALAHYQYFTAREETVELYSHRQMIIARQVASGIERFFEERLRALEIIVQEEAGAVIHESQLQRVFQRFGSFAIILFIDSDGRITHSYPAKNRDLVDARMDELQEIYEKYKNSTSILHSELCLPEVRSRENDNYVCMRVPVYKRDGKFLGLLIGVIEIKSALQPVIQPLLYGENSHVFILTHDGKVIYHPTHPEMVYNDINDQSGYCQKCHDDFALERRMLNESYGWGDKTEFDKQQKWLTFARIDLAGMYWVLGLDMPYRKITESTRFQFLMFFLLSFIMVSIVVLGSIGVYRLNKERMTVERESAHLKARAKLIDSLEDAEIKYRTLVEQSPDAICIYQNQKFIYLNERFAALFGYDQEILMENRFDYLQLVFVDDHPYLMGQLQSLVRRRNKQITFSIRGQNKTGLRLDLRVSIQRFLFSGKIAYQLVVHDITEMKQREREMSRHEHMAFIGEMSTRIAHEIKNPLASLQAGIQLLESNLPPDPETKEYFQRLTGEVQRVDRIVKGLLTYAREDQLDLNPTNLHALINHVVELLKPTVTEQQIKWVISYESTVDILRLDAQKIEQVFWNLLINAVHAIEKEGRIHITVRSAGEAVQIIITDNGKGMPAEIQGKIFQPFFSTKAQGTGLGMAITRKILLAHGGKIDVKSTPEKGTTVYLTIPV